MKSHEVRKQVITLVLCTGLIYIGAGKAAEQRAKEMAVDHSMNPYSMIEEGQSMLKEGDLVVRMNRDPSSHFIKYFNHRDKTYSHSGIVLYENGYPYVFHIVDGAENPDGKLRKDSLKNFCDPRKNVAFGIFRYEINRAEIEKLKEIIHEWYAKAVRFDTRFDLKTDDRMYCSEMITKALAEASGKKIMIQTTQLSAVEASFLTAYTHLPFNYTNHLNIIPIDALYVNPFCHPIKKYSY
jgi:Permuted papain-like amidase enzyme, YaeF/YiiX, C92 family